MPDIVVHLVAAAVYVGLAWHFWNTRWRRSATESGAPQRKGLLGWERAAILVPIGLHGWLIYDGIFASPELRFGFAQALSVMTWLAVVLYWTESLFYSLDGMEPLVLPLAAVAAPLPGIFPGLASSGTYAQAGAFKLHLALAMVAYSLFVIALLHATLMAVAERQLHRKSHFLAERRRAHRVDELLHHRQRDVGLEQRDAHLAQRLLHVRLGEARFAADRLDDLGEARGQVIEHRVLN